MRSLFPVVLLAIASVSCAPAFKQALDKKFEATEEKFQDQTGFVLYDPDKQETLYDFHGNRYFTPASNTKIFTFFASLKILPDSVPALRYVTSGDSLIFWGTGDPSFLYKNVFTNTTVYDFLRRSSQSLYFSNNNFATSHFGAGWAWDDYNDYYSTERSPFPVYGNIFWVEITRSGRRIKPAFFNRYLTVGEKESKPKIERSLHSNDFIYHPPFTRKQDTLDIPFHVDASLITALLQDTLKRPVKEIKKDLPTEAATLYSIKTDSLYRVMMQESDNFIAEQLLLMCSGVLSDTLQPEIAIKYVKENFLNDLKDEPEWVDGSGLSRYNLFTPRSVVQVWDKIYRIVPRERLLPLLATGGKNGTVRNWYKAEKPYIFGKTGSLSNNHCLSGYLVTKSGRMLIFSFMNSNFTATTTEIRKNMQEILNRIYENY
jgi:D-alanyl-D-alanine carboxypeptidase/D-alanyl-D-alanine-endopeptidase (penicillin-binding protein 4)